MDRVWRSREAPLSVPRTPHTCSLRRYPRRRDLCNIFMNNVYDMEITVFAKKRTGMTVVGRANGASSTWQRSPSPLLPGTNETMQWKNIVSSEGFEDRGVVYPVGIGSIVFVDRLGVLEWMGKFASCRSSLSEAQRCGCVSDRRDYFFNISFFYDE